MTFTDTQVDTFAITPCCVCGIKVGLPTRYIEYLRNNAGTFHCPNGHVIGWQGTEADRLRKQLAQAQSQREQIEAECRRQREFREATERKLSAAKGQATRLRKRTVNGCCPCCNRHFGNLHRHMTTQHPDYAAAKD